MNASTRSRKAAVGVAGSAIVVLGVVLVPLPGPGTLLIIGGLALLRREFPAAGRLLDRLPAPGPLRALKGKVANTDDPG